MSERQRDSNNWAAPVIKDGKAYFDSPLMRKKLNIPAEWGELALHHQISKFYLQRLGDDVSAIIYGHVEADAALAKAAKAFWDTAHDVTPNEVKRWSQDFVQILWNMPLNLEIGPAAVANNPGIGFDPNTEPDEERGKRKLTNVSLALQQLERTYLKAIREGGLTATHLSNMAGNLTTAFKNFQSLAAATGTLLAPPYVEQWVVDLEVNSSDANDKFQRKGLKIFPGEKAGKGYFRQGRDLGGLPANIVQYKNQDTAMIATADVVYTLQISGQPRQVTIHVNFPQSTLYHICLRHTYAYFDPGQAKVVNSFWPNPITSYSDVQVWVTNVLPIIGRVGGDYLQSAASTGEDLMTLQGPPLRGHNIRIGETEGLFYFIASIEFFQADVTNTFPEEFEMVVKTATLDANAHAYTHGDILAMNWQ